MADAKLTALTNLATVTADDLVYVVDDPAGTPASRKAAASVIATYCGTVLVNDTAFAASWDSATTTAPSKNAVFDAMKTRTITFGNTGTAGNDTVYLTTYAPFACTIDSIQNIKTTSGTVTAAVKINGTNVTGLSAVAVTSTVQDVSASGANTVAVGDEITLVLSSASSPVGLRGTLVMTRT